MLGREGNETGIAARSRRARTRFKIVCGLKPAGRELRDVTMAVDSTGQYQLAAGINYLYAFSAKIAG